MRAARWSARLVAAFQRSVFVVPRMMPLRLTGFFCTATWAAVGILCVVPACPNDGIAAPQSRTVRIRMKLRFKICLLNAKTPQGMGSSVIFSGIQEASVRRLCAETKRDHGHRER